ncbi:hypothetical protein [Diplocloster modestus]|uniref:Uncharacterized protein n=1 Tax=Diplocloster modestus TaxID=2850322 RepID=A0ABS6K9U5_9FIRM|nr:hypothetical protein [Diplocloster modestus]MBU9727276.1 hypothetical protein [Diplocloster modestus]
MTLFQLYEKKELPLEIQKLLESGNCGGYLQAPCPVHPSGPVTFVCPSLLKVNGSTLLLGLADEHTALGRGLVNSLWFDREMTLWLHGADVVYKLSVKSLRCLITGPLFARMLLRARQKDASAEIGCAWELCWQSCEQTQEPLPAALPLPVPITPDLHLDNPRIRNS